jgi:hypothetical protein
MISTHPHERFSAVLSLDPSNTSGFASSVGDTNPLHHDADYAAATRFGRLLDAVAVLGMPQHFCAVHHFLWHRTVVWYLRV